MGQAAEPLKKLAQLSDASVKDIEAGRALMEEARLKTLETKALCDLITAQPVADDPRLKGFQFEDWERLKGEVHGSICPEAGAGDSRTINRYAFSLLHSQRFSSAVQRVQRDFG